MGLVDQALEALFLEGLLRQRGRGAGTADEHGIRLGRHDLQDLAGDRGVVALEAFAGDDLQLAGFGDLGEFLVPAFAVGIGKTDEGDSLDVLVSHVLDDGGGHVRVVLGGLEDPLALGVHRFDDNSRAGHRDQRCFVFDGDVHHRQRIGRRRRADDDIDLVLGDQLFDVLGRLRRVGRIVKHDVIDLLAGDGRRQQ